VCASILAVEVVDEVGFGFALVVLIRGLPCD